MRWKITDQKVVLMDMNSSLFKDRYDIYRLRTPIAVSNSHAFNSTNLPSPFHSLRIYPIK
jgi:hypothetical protein